MQCGPNMTKPSPLAPGPLLAFLMLVACSSDDEGELVAPQPPPRPTGPPPQFEPAVSAPRPPAAISGGTLRVLPDARTAMVSDPDRDRVYAVDYRKPRVLATIELEPGDEPGRIVDDTEGRVHVALRRGGAVVTLAPRTGEVLARRPVCAAPRGLAYDERTKLLHVACAEGELVSLPAAPDGEVARRLVVERDLRDVVVDGDVLLVSRFRSAEVLEIDAGGRIARRFVPPQRQVPGMVRHEVSGAGGAGAGSTSKVATMVPSVAWRLVPYKPGEALLLHQRALAEEVGVVPGGYGGQEKCGSIVETTVSAVGTVTAEKPQPGSIALGGLVLSVDLAVSADGSRIAVVSPGNARHRHLGGDGGQVVVLDNKSLSRQSLMCFGPIQRPLPEGAGGSGPGGSGPGGSGAGGSGGAGVGGMGGSGASGPEPDDNLPNPSERRPVSGTGEAVAVAFDARGHLLVQTREPAALQVLTANNATILLAADSRADSGHAVFHTNSGAGLACASCHPEGGDDGRVWRFNIKDKVAPRRTQSLMGGIAATAPFHWEGDLPTLSHLMDEVFVSRMGGPKLGAEYVSTLDKWMNTIPALPRLPPKDTASAERGRALFVDATIGCARCHTGGASDNKNQRVGTGRAFQTFQTPSLRGVAWRAPYMHDGCAAALKDRFSPACGGGDLHGVTSKLGAQQIADLVAFMETL